MVACKIDLTAKVLIMRIGCVLIGTVSCIAVETVKFHQYFLLFRQISAERFSRITKMIFEGSQCVDMCPACFKCRCKCVIVGKNIFYMPFILGRDFLTQRKSMCCLFSHK